MLDKKEVPAPELSVGADKGQTPCINTKIIATNEPGVNDEIGPERPKTSLKVFTLDEALDSYFEPKEPVIENFLNQGTYILAGASKIGKSFLVAEIAYHVATGSDLWNPSYRTHQGRVLYLALEDDMDLMKTVAENTKDTKSAKEQLDDLAEQKKQDLENTLLKQALAESSGRCERLLAESNRLLQENEKNRKEDAAAFEARIAKISEQVSRIETADGILKESVKDELKILSCDIHRSIVNDVNAALAERQKHVIRATDDMITNINVAARQIKQAEKRLFRFDGAKAFLFWTGQVVNIITVVLLIWWMFLK